MQGLFQQDLILSESLLQGLHVNFPCCLSSSYLALFYEGQRHISFILFCCFLPSAFCVVAHLRISPANRPLSVFRDCGVIVHNFEGVTLFLLLFLYDVIINYIPSYSSTPDSPFVTSDTG